VVLSIDNTTRFRSLISSMRCSRCPLTVLSMLPAAPTSRSAVGHVWTAPWQELSDVFAALVGCGHVSGLLVRQVWPLALMLCADRVPIVLMHLKVR